MKTNKLVSLALIATMALLPLQADQLEPVDPVPPQDTALAICVVTAVGIAMVGIYIIAKRCEPKYYWLMDNDQPPKFWVGTATAKECQINEWKRIGGPYKRPEDAPPQHPDPTNRVNSVSGPVMKITVEQSNDLLSWAPVYTQTCDPEDFAYFPTTNGAAMFRLRVGAP